MPNIALFACRQQIYINSKIEQGVNLQRKARISIQWDILSLFG